MQISNVLSGFTDAAKLGAKKAETGAASLLKILKPGDSSTISSSASRAAMNEILKKYDVTDITPEDFTKMIAQLHDANAISDQEFQNLSSIRTDLESQGVKCDQSVNLVELYGDNLRKAEEEAGDKPNAAGQQKLATMTRKLDWLQKFALIHSNPEATSIDMAA
jgi:hypothetical protein